jgi:hypothetical protein
MTQSQAEAMVRLTAADGFALDAFEAAAGGDRAGGVVILQEIFGLTDQLKSVARFFSSRATGSTRSSRPSSIARRRALSCRSTSPTAAGS